jgi:YXWGXW repeat-containing protein
MKMRQLIVGGLVAATLGTVSIPAAARTNVDLFLNFGPPAAPYEYVPAPRAGWSWVPGYWDLRHGRHYWVAGHWMRHRPGYYYQPARWVDNGSRWYYHRPYWRAGDRDRDGVPNRYDRFPDNPYRR